MHGPVSKSDSGPAAAPGQYVERADIEVSEHQGHLIWIKIKDPSYNDPKWDSPFLETFMSASFLIVAR